MSSYLNLCGTEQKVAPPSPPLVSELPETAGKAETRQTSESARELVDGKAKRFEDDVNVHYGVAKRFHENEVNVHYGFVLTRESSDEVTNLLALFNLIATVSAFLAGIVMSSYTSVNLEELEYAEQFMIAAGYTESLQFLGLMYSSGFGLIFAGLTILSASALSISLSSLNISSQYERSDVLLFKWMENFSFFHRLNMLLLVGTVFFVTLNLFFVGCIKYPKMANGEDTYQFMAIGIVFFIVIGMGFVVFLKRHFVMVEVVRNDINTFNNGRAPRLTRLNRESPPH